MTSSTSPGTPEYDDRALASAVGLIGRGRTGVETVAVLTDEELLALDGVGTPQLTAMPFLDQHAEDEASQVPLARTAMRSMMTRKEVVSEVESAEFEQRPLADDKLLSVAVDPTILGALVLRRTSRLIIWFEREISVQTHRLYYYPHEDAVLEEEVTADGVHMFSVMPRESVAPRVGHLVDQLEVGGEDGEPKTLAVDTMEDDPEIGARLAETRALTVGTMVSRTEEVAKRVTFHMTSDEVIAGQPSEDGSEVTLIPVSPATVQEIVRDLFDDSTADATGDAEAEG